MTRTITVEREFGSRAAHATLADRLGAHVGILDESIEEKPGHIIVHGGQ
jgi:hypothetical protein